MQYASPLSRIPDVLHNPDYHLILSPHLSFVTVYVEELQWCVPARSDQGQRLPDQK